MASRVAVDATVIQEPAGTLAEPNPSRNPGSRQQPGSSKRLVQRQDEIELPGAQPPQGAQAPEAARARTLVVDHNGVDMRVIRQDAGRVGSHPHRDMRTRPAPL